MPLRAVELVSELLWHSGIQITADAYPTVFQEVDTAAAEAPEDKPGAATPKPEAGLNSEGCYNVGGPGRT